MSRDAAQPARVWPASETRRFDAVVFDNDGLLLDTEESWTRAERTLFERRGLDFTPEHKRQLLGTSAKAAAALLETVFDAPGRGRLLIAELGMLVFGEMSSYAAPRPGALELLARLREAAIPAALASNSPRMLVNRALATAGIPQDTFATIVTADTVSVPKPAPDVYLAACAALGTEPARTFALEDSPTGVAAAVAAGCFTVGVPSLDGIGLDEAAFVADSLDAPAVLDALGL
jgi:HAD superfamily hydrolase (TIGR01509 family)